MFDNEAFEALFTNQFHGKTQGLPTLTADQVADLGEWNQVSINDVEHITKEGKTPYLRVTYIDKDNRWMFKQVYFRARSYSGFDWSTLFHTVDQAGFDAVKKVMLDQVLSIKIVISDPDANGKTYPNAVDHKVGNAKNNPLHEVEENKHQEAVPF